MYCLVCLYCPHRQQISRQNDGGSMNDYRENEWKDEFPALTKHAHLMAWLCLVGFVGLLIKLALP